ETTFSSGDFEMTAMELNTQASGAANFPYESVDELVDEIIDGLHDEGYL
ncbi:MAG: MTH865 family protein, partial [Halobacteriales archaeon]